MTQAQAASLQCSVPCIGLPQYKRQPWPLAALPTRGLFSQQHSKPAQAWRRTVAQRCAARATTTATAIAGDSGLTDGEAEIEEEKEEVDLAAPHDSLTVHENTKSESTGP